MPDLNVDEQFSVLSAGAEKVLPADALRDRIATGRPLRVKLGVDPTAEHVHLGWAVVLRKLRACQDLGHTAVLIVGDFTARIGDPSGRNKTRPMLSKVEIEGYVERLMQQFGRILDTSTLELRYNSEWLEPLGVEGLLRLAGHYTVAQMLQRNDFADRHASGVAISITEFLYPLLQAYDSVAVEADLEVGGSDQEFNLLVARDIQERYGQPAQAILTMPLLEGTDGVKKMSQSLGNYIAITEEPDEMFGKAMALPDELMPKYFRLATTLPSDEVDAIVKGIDGGELRPHRAKRRLAAEIVALYHGAEAAAEAEARFDALFKRREVPRDVPEVDVPEDAVTDGSLHLPALLATAFAMSRSEARRVIAQGGVKVDGDVLQAEDVAVGSVRGKVVQVGKRRFVRIR